MSYCINPNCKNTQNSDNQLFCSSCGSELLIQGNYRVIKPLGEGGFGNTYEITGQGKTKLLKVLTNTSDKAVELFQREAKILSKINLPGIPKVEEDDDFLYYPKDNSQPLYCLIMEKIEGMNLTEYIRGRNNRPLEGKVALQWLKELLEILAVIHDQNLLHRDIKPSNIMLKPDGKLALIDFGAVKQTKGTITAKSGTETATGTGTSIYSVGYAPQEQMAGQAIKQSDIFALGRTFIYLLTAKEPHDPLMYDGLEDRINWRKFANQNISENLGKVIDQMTERLAKDRPDNVRKLLQLLNPPPSPSPPSKSESTVVSSPPSKSKSTVVSSPPSKSKSTVVSSPPPIPSRRKFLLLAGYISFGLGATFVGSKIFGSKQSSVTETPIREETSAPQESSSENNSTFDLGGGVTLEMVKIPGGSFLMGSPDSDQDASSNEKPQHQVTIAEDFYLGKYEVTQAQYQAIMGTNPSYFSKGGDYPVENVSWNDAVEFCQKLSAKTGKTFKLPSEAQWEYACRAGTQTRYYYGDDASQLGDYAWYDDNSGNQTHQVGQKNPNNFGLYDMIGNVWEWCEDNYHDSYNNAPNNENPWYNSSENNQRILRGGSWFDRAGSCRSAYRSRCDSGLISSGLGFRVFCAL